MYINFEHYRKHAPKQYSNETIRKVLQVIETKNPLRIEEIVKNLNESVTLEEALPLFTNKIEAIKALSLYENNAKPGPDAYMTGLDKEEEDDKEDQIKKQSKMDDDDPSAYKEMPGDEEAREKGKVKTSKHTKAYAKLYDAFDAFMIEGTMSDIHLMASEVKSEDEFVKRFFNEYANKIKKTKESEEWAKSLYSDMASIDEKKYYIPKYDNAGYKFAEKLISDLRSKQYRKWSDDEFDEFRRAMIKHFDLEIPDYLLESTEEQLDSMAYGQLERCVDYATMIRERYDNGYSFDSWMYGKITKAEEHLNAVFDSMDGDDGVIESSKINEDLKKDLQKFVKKNEKEIDKRADEDDWDGIYDMIYTEFDIDPESDRAKEVRTLLNLVY